MAEVVTSLSINPSQLGVELGRVALRCISAPNSATVSTDAVTQAQLQAAIDAHVADSNWTDPNPPPPTSETQLQTAVQAARARALEVAADPVNNQFTVVQMNRILAHYILRVTR